MSVLEELQRGVGQALRETFRAVGAKYRYTAITDRTTDPPTQATVDIFMNPTPLVKMRERLGGRFQEFLASGAQLAAEALPVFVVSRNSLEISSGVFHEPNTDDVFQELDSNDVLTGQVFEVVQVTAIGGKAGGYFLTVVTKFHDKASG